MEKSTIWEKENIRLYEDEAADREFARVESETASDSDLLRQALRNTEQLIDDFDNGKTLRVCRLDGSVVPLVPELFKDSPDANSPMIRRSLILHKASKERINSLRGRLGVEDISAVARFALRFFSHIVREATKGARFFVTDNLGVSTEVRFGAFGSPREVPEKEDNSSPMEQPPLPVSGGVFDLPTRPTSGRAVISRPSRHDVLKMK